MKRLANLLMVLVFVVNQVLFQPAVESHAAAQPTSQAQATLTPTITPTGVASPNLGAYPPPATATSQPAATKAPTSVPAKPTPVLTSTPTPIPTEENPSTGPQIRLEKNVLTYEPGKPIELKWNIANSKSGVISSKWQVRTTLPSKWAPADASIGIFDAQKRQLKVIPSSLSINLSISSTLNSGDEDILVEMYEGEKYLSGAVLHLRAKTSATIQKSGGEISGQAGRTKVKVSFPSEVLPSDSLISLQSPEEFPSTLPPKGKYVVELDAKDMKGNAFHKFNGFAQIEMSYDPEEIGIHPSALALYYLDEGTGAWRILPGQVDTTRNVIIAQTTHFSLYALGENSWESVKVPPLDSAQVAEFTGAAAYSLPIEVPNGPGGMKPSISLDYNSMSAEGIYFNTPIGGSADNVTAGAQASIVGLGWTLSSGGFVERNMGKDISSDVDDTYSLVVGGMSLKLVPISSGSGYIDYQSTDGNFMKIRRIKQQGTQNYQQITIVQGNPVYLDHTANSENDKWVAWDKTGTRFTFDKRAYYMEVSPNSTGDCYPGYYSCTDRPWSWYLTEIQYPSGQTLAFTYTTERDQKCYLDHNLNTGECRVYSYAEQAVYPDEIQYPDGKTKVKFNFIGRPDYVWYWGDADTKVRYEKQRLNSIQVVVNARITREYQLNYFTNTENLLLPGSQWTPADPYNNNNYKNYERISALKKVVQYGLDGVAGGYQLPEIAFSYTNQMFLTDVDNGQGGKATFTYEIIDPNAYAGAGAPYTASDGDLDQKMYISQGETPVIHVTENYPLQNTSSYLPVRPGQGYRLTCAIQLNNGTGQVKLGLYYDSGVKNYSKLFSVAQGNYTDYTAIVVIPANAKQALPVIKYEQETVSGSELKVNLCSGYPVLTHYRVTQRTLSDTPTNTAYTYTYAYEGAAVNDTTHSNYAALDSIYRSGSSLPYTEFRGHSKVTVTAPDGLRTETFFDQTDVNKGRIKEVKQYSVSLLLTWSKTHWVDPSVVISEGQVAGLCAKKSGSDPCYRDQKVVWSYSDWEETRQYGQGVTDENSTAYVGLHRSYQYATQPPYGYGNLLSVTEQNHSGANWVSYRKTRTSYSSNMIDGGTNPNSTRYLVGLPGSINVYKCTTETCDETLPDLVKSTCYLYDNPVDGGNGICSLYLDGATKTEILDTPDSGLLTGTRTLLHFGDGGTPDYATPHYSDEIYRYDTKGNRIRTTLFTGEGIKTSLASTGSQQTETCYGVSNQPTGCQDDGYYSYPIWEKNALYQTISRVFDYSLGVPTSETDPNGAVTYATYDAFGRYTKVILPGDNSLAPTYQFEFHDGSPFWVAAYQKSAYGLTNLTRRVYDGLGRLIQSQQANQQLANGYQDVVIDTNYDFAGRVIRQSVPAEISTFDGTTSIYRPQTGTPATVSTYDLVGRPLAVTAPDQSVTTYTYGLDLSQNRLTTTIKDARNKEATTYLDAFSRTSQVTPLSAGPGASYQYDAADRLLSSTYGNATVNITYDLAGRKIGLHDPDLGNWSYQYDGAGNLKNQTDNRGCTTNLSYDNLNRLTGKTFGTSCTGNTNPIAFSYDQSSTTNTGIGRRTGMSDHSGSTAWEYDLRGRLTHEAKTVIDFQNPANQQDDLVLGTYHTYWSYNPDDTVKQKVYPDLETVNYSYFNQKAVNQVYSILPDTNSDFTQLYVSATMYDEAGRIVSQTAGNQFLQTNYTYYDWTTPNGLGRLHTLKTFRTSDSYPLQDLRYENSQTSEVGYDAVGNLRSIEDWRKDTTTPYNLILYQRQAFTYDDINRLTSASVTGQGSDLYNEIYQYNPTTGNLSQKGSTSYGYNGTSPHAVTHLNNQSLYQYDANGNMTSRNFGSVTYSMAYDAENQLTSMSGTGLDAGYAYDGDGNRVIARIGTFRTVYIGNDFEAEIAASAIPVSAPTLTNYSMCHDNRCNKVFVPVVTSDGSGSSTPPIGMTQGNFGNTYYHTHPSAPAQSIQWKIYYSAGSQRVALRQKANSTDSLIYLLSDHLGSTTKTVDTNGNIVEDVRYKAWGETRFPAGTTAIKRKYTGQLDAESGLIFFNARWYDPNLSRFLQPDSRIPKPQNPIAWDRYAFSANNPLRYIDPTGHDWLDSLSQFVTGFVAEVDRSFLATTPQLQAFYGPDAYETDAMLIGRLAADVVEIIVGGAAIPAGVGGIGIGAAACATGIGCPGGVAVAAGGVLVVGLGANGVVQGAIGIGQNLSFLTNRGNGNGSTNDSDYYVQGKQYTRNDLNGATLLRKDTSSPKSEAFANFIRSLGKNFRSNDWKYVMETWELPDGTQVENHYWMNKSGETWYHK